MLSSNSSLTLHRYFRLMALATVELLCTTPFSSYFIYLDATSMPISPYKGWADLHFDYSRVDQVPSVIWHLSSTEAVALELTRWLMVVCALVFFLFFGFAEEARRNYKTTALKVARIFGFKSKPMTTRRVSIRWEYNHSLASSLCLIKEPISRVPKMTNTDGSSALPVYVTKHRDVMHDSSSVSVDISSRFSTKASLSDISVPSPTIDLSPQSDHWQRKSSEFTLASPTSSIGKDTWYNGTYGRAY